MNKILSILALSSVVLFNTNVFASERYKSRSTTIGVVWKTTLLKKDCYTEVMEKLNIKQINPISIDLMCNGEFKVLYDGKEKTNYVKLKSPKVTILENNI